MTTLRNFTPHVLNIILPRGEVIDLPSEGVARVAEVRSARASLVLHTGEVVPVTSPTYGEVTGLPAPVAGVVLIVSALVRAALPDRADLASPGPLLRDASGQPTGCQGLSMAPAVATPTAAAAAVGKMKRIAEHLCLAGWHDGDPTQLNMGEDLLAQIAQLEAALRAET
jgi:hypothetical protein